MGQDFNLTPGSPIGAIGDSKLIGTLPGWYSGQPFQWYQLLNENGGTTPTAQRPYAGRYWYLAEQIAPVSQTPGTIFRAGQPVALYANSGTGIEIGWANGNGQTLAQSTGQTGDASHGNAPAGVDFANFLRELGVA